MQVSIIQLFDMTIPFGTNVRDTEYSMVVAHERNFTARLIARNCASADRHDAGAPRRRVEKPGAQIEAVSRDAEHRARNKSAKQSDGHERMNVGPGMGMARMETLEIAFIGNLQMSVLTTSTVR